VTTVDHLAAVIPLTCTVAAPPPPPPDTFTRATARFRRAGRQGLRPPARCWGCLTEEQRPDLVGADCAEVAGRVRERR
jgi:hypothetical protein